MKRLVSPVNLPYCTRLHAFDQHLNMVLSEVEARLPTDSGCRFRGPALKSAGLSLGTVAR